MTRTTAMTDPHQEAIERVAAYHECAPSKLSEGIWAAYFEDEVNFAEQAVNAERKLEEAMRLLLWIEKWVRTGSPGDWCIADWNKETDAFLRENGGNK